MTWAGLPLLAVDTETTGVDPSTDRVVEAAAVIVMPDGTVGPVHRWIVNPGIDIPTAASDIHGITTDIAQRDGADPRGVLDELAGHLRVHDGPVAIYNARFDWPLLVTEAARYELPWPDAHILDPLVLDKHLDPYRKGSRRLADVARQYGVTLTEDAAHGATADATATGQLVRALIATEPRMAATSLADLQHWQNVWHDQQAASFAEYKRRTDPGFTKELGWPLPVGDAA